MLIEQQKPESQFQKPPPPDPPPISQSDTTANVFPSSSESVCYVHLLKNMEENMPVQLKCQLQDFFVHHGILWQEISTELCKTFKTKLSSTQP